MSPYNWPKLSKAHRKKKKKTEWDNLQALEKPLRDLREMNVIPMGEAEATICYGRPSAKGRAVMGELVPFDQAWRTGANEATAIHIPFAATIGGVEVEPGSYSIYTVPGETEWEITLSRSFERWGIPISAEVQEAVVGTFTRPAALSDEMVETMTFTWEAHGEMMGHVVLEWENTRVEFPIHMAGMNH